LSAYNKVRNRFRKMITQVNAQNTVPYSLLFLGLIALVFSAIYYSYVLSFVGLGLVFWGALFLYIKRTKYVKSDLLNVTSFSTLVNIEKLLTNTKANSQGIYLPPRRLQDYTSSLVFVPTKPNQPFPTTKETDAQKLEIKDPAGLLITPPGLGLSKLLEKELKRSFTETSIKDLETQLPKLFDRLEITKYLSIHTEESKITVNIRNSVLDDLCRQTAKLEKTHKTVGCPLSSALACIFAKATGKSITIQAEETEPDETTTIHFKILED
jgi:hypothetical protein